MTTDTKSDFRRALLVLAFGALVVAVGAVVIKIRQQFVPSYSMYSRFSFGQAPIHEQAAPPAAPQVPAAAEPEAKPTAAMAPTTDVAFPKTIVALGVGSAHVTARGTDKDGLLLVRTDGRGQFAWAMVKGAEAPRWQTANAPIQGPVSACFRAGTIVLAARATEGRVAYVSFRPDSRPAPTAWKLLDVRGTLEPVLADDGSQCALLAVDAEGAPSTHQWDSGKETWTATRALGGVLTSPFAWASPTPGALQVFGRGSDSHLYTNALTAREASGWAGLGGPLASSPVGASGENTWAVAARTTDGAITMWTPGRPAVTGLLDGRAGEPMPFALGRTGGVMAVRDGRLVAVTVGPLGISRPSALTTAHRLLGVLPRSDGTLRVVFDRKDGSLWSGSWKPGERTPTGKPQR